MKRQTLLGILFLLVGLGVIAAAIAPVFSHQPVALWPLLAGIGTTVFGAWLIPSSGAGVTFNQIIVSLGNTNLPFVGNGGNGGRRAGDNPPPPSGDAK